MVVKSLLDVGLAAQALALTGENIKLAKKIKKRFIKVI